MEKIIILLICITIALVIMIYTIANIRKIRKEFNEAKNDLLKMISEHEYLALKETTQDGELRVLPDWTQQETTNNFKNFLKISQGIQLWLERAEKNLYQNPRETMLQVIGAERNLNNSLKIFRDLNANIKARVELDAKNAKESIDSVGEIVYAARNVVSDNHARSYDLMRQMIELANVSVNLSKQKERLPNKDAHRDIMKEVEAEKNWVLEIMKQVERIIYLGVKSPKVATA